MRQSFTTSDQMLHQSVDTALSKKILRSALLGGCACLCLVGAACQQSSASTDHSAGNANLHPEYDKATGQLKRLEYSSHGDGKIDMWAYMDGIRVVRVEIDENGDGKPDRWEYHKQGSEGSRGSQGSQGSQSLAPDKTIERVERATRYDGKVSRWEYFENGAMTRSEEDTDGDGTIDKWETYSGGVLTVMALDSQHRGRPDRRLIYGPDGALDHIETDPSGSGTFQPLTERTTTK